MKKKLTLTLIFCVFLFYKDTYAYPSERYVLIILDTSSSMMGPKIETAKNVLLKTFYYIPEDTKVALRVFNQRGYYERLKHKKEEICKGSTRLLDFDSYEVGKIKEILSTIVVDGETPLGRTIDESWYDFPRTNSPKDLIIITDGYDTCDADPCEHAKEINRYYDVNVSIIAVQTTRKQNEKLKCVTDATGGEFIHITNTNDMEKKVYELLEIKLAPLVVIIKNRDGDLIYGDVRVYDRHNKIVAETTEPVREYSPSLPEGTYHVVVSVDGEEQSDDEVELNLLNNIEHIFTFK